MRKYQFDLYTCKTAKNISQLKQTNLLQKSAHKQNFVHYLYSTFQIFLQYIFLLSMIKSLLLIILLAVMAAPQTITPYYVLPVQTTQNTLTSYSFLFNTDTDIVSDASVTVTFPFEFSPNALTQVTRIKYQANGATLLNASFRLNLYTFNIRIGHLAAGNVTIIIQGVVNPADYTTSSYFALQTLFRDVVVTSNAQFARVPFTPLPVTTPGGTVNNYVNTYIEQGSSWAFSFTLAGTYPANSSLRFLFPQDFYSNKVQCNVSGAVDASMLTRVFPSQNVYDCLNLQQPLSGTLGVVLSGVVNPSYQMTAGGFQVHILQPNNMIVSEIITSTSTVLIKAKPLNMTLTIPNQYRNNSATYIFQINPDTNLLAGDTMVFTFAGLWTLFTNMTNIISGVTADLTHAPKWSTVVNTSSSLTTLTLSNFSMIAKTTQFTFYLPLVTPLLANTYSLNVKSYRLNGGLAQTYSQNIVINATTGYIREMKLHPMQRAIKLPVGQTGPLEIVLFLQNNLPQTNVLTYGKIVMQITPNIPAPIVSLNGVPKCYFYKDIPAVNCTFDSSDPTQTIVTIFTPANFNFQQSEVPLTITTEGYQQPFNQGITIDTLVKRYFFEIQFYSHLRPPPIPQEVIFDDWIPNSIPLTSLTCDPMNKNAGEYDHLKCSFVTPNQVLNSDGHIHFFRVEFSSTNTYGWNQPTNVITPDYPCLMYGSNVGAVPYVRCDYVTWWNGPYKSSQTTTSYNYITFYGLSTIPGGSSITFEIPFIQRMWNGYETSLKFSILEDTPGYNSPIVYIYTQTVSVGSNYGTVGGDGYETPSITLSNSVINKVTSITLNSYNLGASGISHFVFFVDQAAFPNIGRGNNIACGSHTCSKFDKPIQYFVLYPSSTLGSSATLTFPSIATPPYSGSFAFYTRTYSGGSTIKKSYFYVAITPDTITDCSYKFSPLESISTLYPNSDHFYLISWSTVNQVLSLSGNSYILVTISPVFTLSSTYCQLTTTATAYDGRGIFCQLTAGGNQIYLKNLNDLPVGTTFNLTVQMRSTLTTSTVSPTVNIQTYWGNGNLVDQVLSLHFVSYPLTNTNLTVFTSFNIPTAFTSVRAITAGYYGHLLVNFQPENSFTVINGSKIILTMPSGFYPAGNVLNLPLSCLLNTVRFPCTYTLSPFTITMTGTDSSFTTSNNVINITTLYQNSNGIYFPTTAGRYLLQLEFINQTIPQSIEKVQQYVDLLPGEVSYFNVSWAHRDINKYNIFTVELKNGPTPIPSYNDATNAGRIYIGFPMTDSQSNNVFASNLGFSGMTDGSVLPCYFDTGLNFVTATVGQTLTCKLRISLMTTLYYTWIEVINFAAVPAGGILRVMIGKVTNPALKQIDINFMLKVKTLLVSSNVESQLYQTTYNMFMDMPTPSITSRSETDSSSIFFQAGSSVGQSNRYFNITPYTGNTFQPNDWFIVNLDPQFPLNGIIYNCLQPFYQYCIIYPTINWLAVKIGNGTILPLQPFITQLPISISRVDTTFTCYTFQSGRWSETITYTMTAAARWLEIRGQVSAFSLTVLGSQNKINVGQKDVQVLVSFTVPHMVPIGGTIEIQFPNNATAVPAIKPHCRSAVTLGSALNGYNTGKPSVNVEGEVGCLVQNLYSWIITGFDTLPANSQVKIYGLIDFPTTATNSLGMGFICTYSTQDPTSVFANGRTIDYLTTNFPLPVQNLTWNVDTTMSMLKAQPLRTGYVGELKFLLNLASIFYSVSLGGGYMYINLWYQSTAGNTGGFNGPSTNLVCTIFSPDTGYKYGCYLTCQATPGTYTGYKILTYQNLPTNTNLEVTITTQKGSAIEGINFPTVVGSYKVDLELNFYALSPYKKNQAYYVDVYGPNFSTLNFNSTVTIPGESNFIIVIFKPSINIATNQQFVIEIPTVALDGQALFSGDLGMGYNNYDSLVFDIFESDITSMSCKVYTADATIGSPVKIVCSNFNTIITTAKTMKFGFWVVNPSSTASLAIPVQVYAFNQPTQTKFVWSIVEAGIRILPITTTPINDIGNFASSTPNREVIGTTFSLTTRNTKALVLSDWYILKFSFDLRNTADANGSLSYNTNLAGTGDVIFLRNSKTILLRIGTTPLDILSSGTTTVNAQLNGLFYNPPYQLTTAQATIRAYAIYNSADACEKIIYSDLFPSLPPYSPVTPSWSIASVYSNQQLGMNDDYQFSFMMGNTASNSTSLVKLISIEFPPFATYDITMQGRQCYEHSSSGIEISSCVIDPNSRAIWVTPVVKAANVNNLALVIQSAGWAFLNPVKNSTIDINKFTIRYFTWPNGQAQPSIAVGSDNWCFFKQDSTTLASSTIAFTQSSSTYYTPHTDIKVPKEVIVNEWEPADYYIGNASTTKLAKTAFRFKLKSPTNFASLSGGSYHVIKLTYSAYYTSPAQSQYYDLFNYVPACELNGFRIHSCTNSGGIITMNFQQSIASGSEMTVKFSVVNPYDESDQGFTLSSTTNTGTVYMPLYLTQSGGTTYYVEVEPFHPFYRTTSAGAIYPSMGISNVALQWGTQAQGQMNYLEFTITLTRNDINGMVLEIPIVNEDGSKIYNTPTLMGLPSGSKYPCSLGVYTKVYCYYIQGDLTNYGTPTRIYIAAFSIPANNSLSFRMLFTNPDIYDVFPRFTFKAFGGTITAPAIMGNELKGMYTLVDPFKIYSKNSNSNANMPYYSTGTLNCQPTRALWQTQTYYDCYTQDQSQPINTYAILQWPLVDSTYGTIGDYDSSSGIPYDHFFFQTGLNQMYVYVVLKLTSIFTPSNNGSSTTSYYRFGYLRMKHHIVNGYKLYLMAKDWTKKYTASVDSTWIWSNKCYNYFGHFSVDTIDVQDRQAGQWSWHYFSINTADAYSINLKFNGKQDSELVIEITFVAGMTFQALDNGHPTCNIDAGVIGHNSLNPVTCVVDIANNKIVLYNVYAPTYNQLKIFYYAQMANTQSGFDVMVKAFANPQAYTDQNWVIFASQTNQAWTLNKMWYSSYPSWAGQQGSTANENPYTGMSPTASDGYASSLKIFFAGTGTNVESGNVRVVAATSTSITVRVTLNGNYDFSDATWRIGFRFYTERLLVSVCNSVSVSSYRYGGDKPNSWCQSGSCSFSCFTGDRMFGVVFSMYRSAYYQRQWPIWYGGEWYQFTFNFNSVTQDVSNNANQIFIQGTSVWELSRYHSNDCDKCGCKTYCWNTCYRDCLDNWGNPDSCPYNCNQYCCECYNCRWLYGWDYRALTNQNLDGWSQATTPIAAAVTVNLLSAQFNIQTELYVYLQNLKTSLSSTMTSTTGFSSQLLISFTGNNVFPKNNNPFEYTTQSESAAYIDCLCKVSSSAITITSGTTYTVANCTRYAITGYPAFLTVRVDASVGQYLACYFPGFNTPTLTTNGYTMNLNFYAETQNHFKYHALPNQFRSIYQTTGAAIGLNTITSYSFNTVDTNYTFWSTYGKVSQNKYYQYYLVAGNFDSPVLYMSSYSPRTHQSICNSSLYKDCRAYNSFFSRRYFLVAQYNGWTNVMNFSSSTLIFPQSQEYDTSNYDTYLGWTAGGWGAYNNIWSTSLNSVYLSPAIPSLSLGTALYSTSVQYSKSLMTVAVDLTGFTLYSNQRTQGPFYGSYISLTLNSFTTIYGCGAVVFNTPTPTFSNNALYCVVNSSTEIKVYSNADWTFTGLMYITFYTDNVPSSSSYSVRLFDKYYSQWNNGLVIYSTGTFSATTFSGSYTALPPTSVLWRRTTYKDIRNDAGPVKLTFNNNYQYVSTYNMGTNSEDSTSDAIVIYIPGSGLSNNAYYCYAREYSANQYTFYREYVVNCIYYSTTQILIKSIPSHIMTPNYYYEFIIYKNTGSGSSLISVPSTTTYLMQVGTVNCYTGGGLQYYEWIPVINYLDRFPISLNYIYILTQEAAAVNSLLVNFNINFAVSSATTVFYLEFTFDNLDLNYFGISNGGNIPCLLKAGFSTLSGKLKSPTCYGYADGLNSTSPLKIRILKFAGFSSGATFSVVFDNFNNPPITTQVLTPINMRINLVDRTNTRVYTSYFPNIYISQSNNIAIPSNLGGSMIKGSNNRAITNTQQYMSSFSWPYASTASSSEKIVMKITGGITCCQSFTTLVLNDTQSSYTLLWSNPNANVSVYSTPSKSISVSTKWCILNVINPNQVAFDTYSQNPQVTFIMYSAYRTTYMTKLNQPAFSSYGLNNDFVVTTNPAITEANAHFSFHSYYPMTFDFTWTLGLNSYAGRNISYIIMYFTSGIRYVEAAWFKYTVSPNYINPVGHVKVGYDTTASKWFVNITGVMDSVWSSSYPWYVRVRLYASGNGGYFYHTSYVYNFNGGLEFTASSGQEILSSDSWSSSSNIGTVTTFALEFQRHTKNYFELAKNVIYAAASQTTNKLFFKFTAPYNMSQVESLSFVSSSASYPASQTPNNGLHCIIQPTFLTLSSYGVGLYAPCTYSSGTFSVAIPTGGLTTSEYLLTIIDRQQLTSTFNMPTTPQRIEVSLIYNSMLNLQYGDVFTLDFAGMMTTYSMTHAHLVGGQYDMLGFNFNPAFTLPAASTSAPVTESVLSFEVESNYYDSCLNLASVFINDGMAFYSGVYFSHYSSPAIPNANTRILCGQNIQAQDWAPIKLTVTDYGAVAAGTGYYFRFPLITLPLGANVPLTYKVKLLQYSNGNAYPDIISQFSYENKESASNSYSPTNEGASISPTNNAVQKTMSLAFSYTSLNIYSTGYETIVKFDNDQIPALTSLSTLTSLSNSGYSYQYYPNINLCSFIKNADSNSYGFSLGTYPTSIDQQSFQLSFVFTFISITIIRRGWFNSGTQVAASTINIATSWTSSTFTKGSNIVTANSIDLYTVSWSANYLSFPEGSYMILTLSPNFALIDEYCNSYSGFLQGTAANSNLVCKRYASNQIIISGYATLSSSASLAMSLYMKITDLSITPTNVYSQSVNIVVYSSTGATIINANTVSLTLTLTQVGSLNLGLSGTMVQPYINGNAFPLYITFQLNSHTLTSPDYLQIDFGNWVIDPATTGTQVFKYQLSGSIYWVPTAATLVSGNSYKVPVYNNYSMNAGTQITLLVDTFAPTTYYGALNNDLKWNNFKIYAYHSGTLVEQAVTRIWTEPYGHASFVATPVLNYIGVSSLWEFSVTPNISAAAGDSILMEFQTADGLQATLFSNNLGASISTGNSGKLDCAEYYNTHVVSSSIIQCRIYLGDNTQTPSIPTTIAIPITQAITANTAIKFNILNLLNPSLANYPMSVVFKLATPCSSSDANNLCAYYKSSTYLTFNNVPSVPAYGNTGYLFFSPDLVSATNTVHSFTGPYTLAAGDYVKATYYTQVPIPSVCAMSSNNGICYSYPMNNSIVVKVNTAITSTFSVEVAGMTNPYQKYYGNYTFNIEVWRGGAIYVRYYADYRAITITTDPTTSTALSISFTPTLTPDYELKYNFWNIANITITKMLQNSYVRQIRIQAPSEITIDGQYCNATVQTFPGEALPYPYRLVCQTMASNYVILNLFSNFPAWNSGFTQRSIYVYLRYTIMNSQTVNSNAWSATAYSDPSSNSWFYEISSSTGNFPIVEYQLPFLYVINFPTRSFNQRTCSVGQQCMVYGFIYPTTPKATYAVSYMTFLLPREFKYSSQQNFDSCFVQSTTSTYSTFGCPLTRNNSQITIKFTPPAYNQLYNLFNLDHTVASMLFTAPAFPGNHYTMQVNLWTASDSLVESQYVNLTTVYGYYLSVPLINFVIPLDASKFGLYDLTFTTGTADILPSYTNSATYTVTSAIEISFANSFDAALGTGLAAGSEIACLYITGLTFNIMSKLTCRIYPSVSAITYPTIIVTGYDRIYANTLVRIQFANLKTLAAGITDYCKLGVSYTYYNYGGVKGYIYEPVSFVVGPTSASTTPKTITYTISEVSTNYVGELSNYTLAGSIATGFTPITTSDYFVVQFPPYVFEGRFNLNAQALCSLGASNACRVFGLASQIYIQPSSTVTAASFSFTIKKLLNAAYQLQYVNETVTLFTVVGNKVNALGTATFLKFTQASLNASAIITSIDSIYGGDSGINYYFSFQLNSYLPESGKVSIFFPSIFISLFTVNSRCYLRADSQLLVGPQAYCQIINTYQLVIIPNGVLLSASQPYYVTVTNITNPNMDLSAYKFKLETYYSSNVYSPSVISRDYYSSPTFSLITVKNCQLQVSASIYNQNLPSQYQINLICPATIKQSSELKIYLSWNPSATNLTCSSDSNNLYSTQCSILTEYAQTSKLTYLSIYLRSIQAEKLVSITATVTNGIQGTYSLNASINYNGLVYLQANSNSYYITGSSSSSSAANSISVKSANYPLNRYYTSIYTFSITNPKAVVSTLQIDIPSIITQSKSGVNCGYQAWNPQDDYFNLMLQDGANPLNCSMTGQKLLISQLSPILGNLSTNGFLYLIINGLINPATSVSQANFTFTLINTTSSISQAAGIYSSTLSYSVSNPPTNLQISSIVLSDSRFFVNSLHTFTVTSVQNSNIAIVKSSNLGVVVQFPQEYSDIWQQITPPSSLTLTINGVTYTSTNITMKTLYLFARFSVSTFTSQLSFTSLTVAFNFKNPNKTIDCSVTPIYAISLFDFQANSLFAQTLSNNQICPTLSNRLYAINVTGNTKISAGSSTTFVVSIERPASYLAITPSCSNSAISFLPSVIVFSNFTSVTKNFTISAAVGLTGNFNVTFSKAESNQTFYNDIQFTTLNVYMPIQSYKVTILPFSAKSTGYPIATTIQLEVPSPTDFALTFTTTCDGNFSFSPAERISIPAQTSKVNFYITYSGLTVPTACSVSFSISSLTSNNFVLVNPTVYLSGKASFDKSSNTPPLILELTKTPQNSTDIGTLIVSKLSSTSSAAKYQQKSQPSIYLLNTSSAGANSATFIATTSISGSVYYAVLTSGTPTPNISQSQVYNRKLPTATVYGNATAAINASGVNTISNFAVKSLSTQTSYIMVAYLNSTVGISAFSFLNFSTTQASNGASIKVAMSSTINTTAFLSALSSVWRIQADRIGVLTIQNTLSTMQSTYTSSVMNTRIYIYQIVVAPDVKDDSVRPIDLLNGFAHSDQQQTVLLSFVPQYITTFTPTTRELVPTKPRSRSSPTVLLASHDTVTVQVRMWEQAYVYAVILPNPTSQALSSQIIHGLSASNIAVVSQNYATALTDAEGTTNLTFTLLSDDCSYTVFVSAECVLPFTPRLALNDNEVLMVQVQTLVNLNLKKNAEQAVSVIREVNPVLAKEVKKHMQKVNAATKASGSDNNQKRRKHT